METRVAVISIIVEQEDAIEELNILLHEARQYIVGRMGIPYRAKGISIISIVHHRTRSVHFPEKSDI